jgi:hypothetical protein
MDLLVVRRFMSGRQSFGAWIFGARALGAGVVVLLVAACGCSKKGSILDAVESVANTPQEVLAAEGCKVDVTEEEARVFSDQLIAALREGRLGDLTDVFDYGVMARIATRGSSNRSESDGFRRSLVSSLDAKSGGIFEASVKQQATYRRLRITGNTRGRMVLLRVLAEEGAVNYLDLAIVRNKAGKPVIVDAYIYAIGENFSDTMRRMYLLAGGNPSAGLSVKVSDAEAGRAGDSMTAMAQNFNTGNFAAVLREYQGLPEAFKQERICLALNLQASGQISEDEQRQAMNQIRKYHGDAAWANLMLLGDDMLREDYDSALRRIDRTDGEVGGDPFLDAMRAGVYGAKKDYPAAIAAAQRCVKAEPELVEGHNAVVNMSLPAGRFDLVRSELLELQKRFELDLDTWVETEDFAEFRKSDEYPRWQADRKKL